MPGGVRDFGGGCVGAAMRASVWRGKEGARSEDCRVLGRLLGTRKTVGHSEDCRTLGGRERGLWELVRVSGAACKRMGGEFRGLPEGMDCRRGPEMAANCRVRRDGVSGAGELGRGLFESRGVGRLGRGDLFGRNLVGCREGAARAACCRLFGNRVEAGRGCSGLCREPKPGESGA